MPGPFPAIGEWARRHQAWMHVYGAFGMWAMADPSRSHLTAGVAGADSWATDGHKWLNVPYDCGITLVRRPEDHRRSFAAAEGYLLSGTGFEATNHTPRSSQRARQVEVWAVLRTLGREGVVDLVTRSCRHAQTMAAYLSQAGRTEGSPRPHPEDLNLDLGPLGPLLSHDDAELGLFPLFPLIPSLTLPAIGRGTHLRRTQPGFGGPSRR
jgi:glutamate/tyrosine decarboxylase-like PLP-dependent enzyme